MAQPQRVVNSEPDINVVEQDDESAAVSYSELFGEDGLEENGPWCVDHGQSISCMSTLQIWMALASGKLRPDIKVWRDGRACWEPIVDVVELTSRPELDELTDEEGASVPEQSGIRRVRRPTRHSAASEEYDEPEEVAEPEPAAVTVRRWELRSWARRVRLPRLLRLPRLPRLPRPSRRALQRSLLAATMLGMTALVISLAYPYMLGSPGQLRRVAVDVAERGRFHSLRIQELHARQAALAEEADGHGRSPLASQAAVSRR